MKKNSKVYVAGHKGMVGSAICRKLIAEGFTNLITKTHGELALDRQEQVESFFAKEKPEYVILCAAKVGGIMANSTYKAEFYYQNAMIAQNVIHSSYKNGVKKLINLGSSCIYPKLAPQPLKEEYLLTGPLEPTNDAYAIAKISAIKMCDYYNKQYGTNFISVMPTNLYGKNDNYDLDSSHVFPAMIRKFHEAKISGQKITLWGSGAPLREFMFSDDLADCVYHLLSQYNANEIGEFVNIGTGKDISIKELAELIKQIIGFQGDIDWDSKKPDGTFQKLLDVTKLNSLGWKEKTSLKEGITQVYLDYMRN